MCDKWLSEKQGNKQMQIGQVINTVYGKREIVKVNKASVIVAVDGRNIKVDNRQVEIMNG